MRNINISLIIATLVLSAGANAGNLFTCKLPGNKVASVSIDGAQIYYSYGKEGEQPDVQLDRTQNWFMGNNHYAGANYQLTFRVQKGNYNYVLYSQNYGDKLDEGLVAYNGANILFNKKCTEAAKVDDAVWSAQPADFGMQEETDKVSDMIANLGSDNHPEGAQQQSQGSSQPAINKASSGLVPGKPAFPKEQAKELAYYDSIVQVAPPSDGSSPIKIEMDGRDTTGAIMKITSLVDNVTIMGLTINRGNCSIIDNNTINKVKKVFNIKYGQYVEYHYMSDCSVLEVSVDTNMGTWTSKS